MTTGRPFQGSRFADTGAKQGAKAFAEDWRRCEHGLAVAESKPVASTARLPLRTLWTVYRTPLYVKDRFSREPSGR